MQSGTLSSTISGDFHVTQMHNMNFTSLFGSEIKLLMPKYYVL